MTNISLRFRIKNFTYFKLCLATASHNLKWVKMTQICNILIKTSIPIKPPNNWMLCWGTNNLAKNGYGHD